MSKQPKPKHAPLKPRVAWAVVNNATGEIVTAGNKRWLAGFMSSAAARQYVLLSTERVQKIKITKA